MPRHCFSCCSTPRAIRSARSSTSISEMVRASFYWLLGITAFLIACEIVLHALPVSSATETGYYSDPLIITYPPGHQWTTATGWDLRNAQRNRSNNAGFLADRDFVYEERAVALVGDSYVEASMLAAADRPGAQLERSLGDRPVYAMGGPGSALLDYAERIRLAHEQYGVRDFVVLMERGDVRQSLCGSGNIHGPCLDRQSLQPRTETQAAPGLAKRILRHSAFAQYLFSQLKFSPERLWRQIVMQSGPVAPTKPAVAGGMANRAGLARADAPVREVDAVAEAFFSRIKPYVSGKLVIVIDSDRAGPNTGMPVPDADRARFISLARAAGALVIDTEPVFREHFARYPLKLEVGPYDGHMNALAVRLAMQAAVDGLATFR
ncbi:hypothetical protein [Aromatoleum diolicum]|uniref:hypothetical protein n=1 Tax=Aromatoleum diolicum TaxID=75796 RepID=UPI00145CBA25|nr:hypothetical protein [Aromatoleum diolicum]